MHWPSAVHVSFAAQGGLQADTHWPDMHTNPVRHAGTHTFDGGGVCACAARPTPVTAMKATVESHGLCAHCRPSRRVAILGPL